MKIIFNADDFGHSKGVNFGIIDAYINGVVRSTTMMAGMPGFEHAVHLAAKHPGLGIGVHLTLTAGSSVGGPYQTITDSEGRFFSKSIVEKRMANGEFDLREVETEYVAQIHKIMAAGIIPDHLDSHHHIHNLPGIVDIFLQLARNFGVGVRIYNKCILRGKYADVIAASDFCDAFYDEKATEADLVALISRFSGASLEVMCHPAYLDSVLLETSSYNLKRIYELKVLTNPSVRSFLMDNGHELCSFRDLCINS